ncbi:hypothetical protein [Vibrio sp. YYF0003]|uniref:hypothetical protein n=1 Tax=Vibrio sp. YYF0003 TaxID=3116646 RepID=UPI002EAB329C|nr:hypothetical protein [Vibrio sp. YYF0003]
MKNLLQILFVILAVLSVAAYEFYLYLERTKDVADYSFSIGSYVISLTALLVALRTYMSIDSVNNISKMDGNILENQGYTISLPEIVCRYDQNSVASLQEAVMRDIEYKLKNTSKTASEFADTLQYMIDLIIVFPAVFKSKKSDLSKYNKRMEKILDLLKSKVKKYDSLNKGSLIQIHEASKLFEAIVKYQQVIIKKGVNVNAELLHIRGGILKNNVTQTIYHNYLGLYYHKKSMHEILTILKIKEVDFYSKDGLAILAELKSGSYDLNDITSFLEKSSAHYKKALSISSDDLVWPGFIYFNLARTEFLYSYVVEKEGNHSISIEKAISSRMNQCKVIEEVLNGKSSTQLSEFFRFQEEKARLFKVKMAIAEGAGSAQTETLSYRGKLLSEAAWHELSTSFPESQTYDELRDLIDSIVNSQKVS